MLCDPRSQCTELDIKRAVGKVGLSQDQMGENYARRVIIPIRLGDGNTGR